MLRPMRSHATAQPLEAGPDLRVVPAGDRAGETGGMTIDHLCRVRMNQRPDEQTPQRPDPFVALLARVARAVAERDEAERRRLSAVRDAA
jgi:hypothetical protein